ncbi:sigma 54-interacting transcriptional regulator [Isosphaeraceae bacterium EP7]
MPWIPHLMVLDDDPRVLDSLVPSLVEDLATGLGKDRAVRTMLLRGEPESERTSPLRIKVSAHGYPSERVASYRARQPHQVHLHLVREQGGRFDLARSLLNTQLFAVVVSDLRFSDDAGGQRAGQLFVDEALRVHPELEGLLYSAYPKPDGFPAERFLRKGGEDRRGGPDVAGLADVMIRALVRCLATPSVHAFAAAVADQGLIYQSDAFGTTLAQLFGLSRLLGPDDGAARGTARARRPLPTLLLDGESGTGKRGLAATLHAASARRDAPMAVASCNELTNETLLRGILFGHKRGAFTDAREDRPGLVSAAGKGMLLLDDFHRLPATGSAILHSFLEDGEYARLGEEEIRRHAEAAVVLTVETGPWAERRRSGELPLAFLARVERLPLSIPPLRDRPEDIEAQARWLTHAIAAELRVDIELADDTIEGLKNQDFAESNSRELRNVIERSIYRHARETDLLTWDLVRPSLTLNSNPAPAPTTVRVGAISSFPEASSTPTNEWSRRLRSLAAKMLAKGLSIPPSEAELLAETLFESELPLVWKAVESARAPASSRPTIPLPVWDDLWRCYSVSRLGGPAPAEKSLGIPANTLRQWINDRESR